MEVFKMSKSQPKTTNIVIFIVLCAICGYTAGPAFAFDAEIEINRENLATVEEYEYLRYVIPVPYRHILNKFISALRAGEDSFYSANVWLYGDSEDIISAVLRTPKGSTFPLVEEGSVEGGFEFDENLMYYSLAELQDDFPSGDYTFEVTLAGGAVSTKTVTLSSYDSSSFPEFVDGTISTVLGGTLQLHWSTVADVDEYVVWVENLKNFDDVFEKDYRSLAHPQTLDTTLTGVVIGKSDYQVGVQAEQYFASGVEMRSQQSWYVLKNPVPELLDFIKTCAVKAGKFAGADRILVLGQLGATEADLLDADEIIVTINGDDMNEPNVIVFPIDEISFKNSKYNYARKVNASTMRFKFNCKTKKFSLLAKNVDLTGLSCPVSVKVEIGDFIAEMVADEDIVNGPKKPIPLELMMGVKNTLRIDKFKVKFGKTDSSDSLSITGAFTVAGEPNKAEPVVVILGSQVFTVPGVKFASSGSAEACKTTADEGASVVAKFDFAKCAFSINITKADIIEYGEVDFAIDIFGIHIFSPEKVDLGPCYTFWELTGFDDTSCWWDYTTSTGDTYRSVSTSFPNIYILNEYEDSGADVHFYYTDESDGVHFIQFVLSSWGIEIGFEDFDILYWPGCLRPGQCHFSESPCTGYIKIPGFDTSDINFYGTASTTVCIQSKTSKIVYKGQTYEAIRFTEKLNLSMVMILKSDSSKAGTINITITSNNYAVPGIGVVKFTRKGRVKACIKGEGCGSGGLGQRAMLDSTCSD